MAWSFLRRSTAFAPAFASMVNFRFFPRPCRFCTTILDTDNEALGHSVPATNYSNSLHLSPLFSDSKTHSGGYDIELVDHDTWRVSTGLAQAWRGMEEASLGKVCHVELGVDEPVDYISSYIESDPDFDDIDNMRVRGNLFYKLDRDSKEFEEYSFDFHRRKSSKRENDKKESKKLDKKDNTIRTSVSRGENHPKLLNNKCSTTLVHEKDSHCVEKKRLRTPTFNQLTAPYHEPFCLDIYISKASIRACVIHRVTSKVVAVAHSISKDMKFDLASTRNSAACAAVGAVLAQRALADDIHDVVYTPRKGDRLEGKLQVVLQSIIDNGVNVKVKLKQRRNKKTDPSSRQ